MHDHDIVRVYIVNTHLHIVHTNKHIIMLYREFEHHFVRVADNMHAPNLHCIWVSGQLHLNVMVCMSLAYMHNAIMLYGCLVF